MGPRRVTLMRHGEAQPLDSCPEDFERALTRRGRDEAQEMAARLMRRGLVPDLVLASPAERSWATAAVIAAACSLDGDQLRGAEDLYLADPQTAWRLVNQCPPRVHHLLICGHNPGLSQIAGRFGPAPRARELPTAGLATAVWQLANWATLRPETAEYCGLDAPHGDSGGWAAG